MLSQHFCQLLAAAALPNCAATLDKMSTAPFDHHWGECETSENPRLVWVCQDMLLPLASPKTQSLLSFSDCRSETEVVGKKVTEKSHLLK